MAPEDVTLDSALALLALPREVGVHPESGEPILAGIGRYGPWLRHGSIYAAIPDYDDVLAIGVNRAVVVLADKAVRESRARGPKRVLRELGAHPTTARRCGSRRGILVRSLRTGAATPRCRRRCRRNRLPWSRRSRCWVTLRYRSPPRPPGEGSTTGTAQRALALESRRFPVCLPERSRCASG